MIQRGSRNWRARRARARAGVVFVTAMALLAVVAGCGSSSGGSSSGTNATSTGSSGSGEMTKVSVAVATPSLTTFYPIYVAQKQGFFKEEGLDVTINVTDGTAAATQAQVTGNADLVENDTNSALTAAAKSSGYTPVMFAQDFFGDVFAVYTSTDGGISTAAELKGKKIGVGQKDSIEAVAARQLAESAGLKEGTDYELVVVPSGPQAASAIKSGAIDALAAGPTDAAILKSRGIDLQVVQPATPQPLMFGTGWWATKDYVAEHPDVLKGYLLAIQKAEEYMKQDPQAIADFVKEESPSQATDPKQALALAQVVLGLYKYPIAERKIDPAEFKYWFESAEKVNDVTIPGEPTDYYTNDFIPPAVQ